jgi:hypothetical protein
MNVYIIALIVYGVILIILAAWGISILNGKCEDDVVHNQLRMVALSASIMVTALFCYMLCKNVCFPGDEYIHYIIPLIVVVTGGICLTAFAKISGKIKKCTSSSHASTYKTVITYLGIIPTSIMTVGGLVILSKRFYKWYSERSKAKAKYKKVKKDKKDRVRRDKESAEEDKKDAARAKVLAAADRKLLDKQIAGKKKHIKNLQQSLDAISLKDEASNETSQSEKAQKLGNQIKEEKGKLDRMEKGEAGDTMFGPRLPWD